MTKTKIAAKIAGSVLLWLVITLVVAALIEVNTGLHRPGLTAMITINMLIPGLIILWRR